MSISETGKNFIKKLFLSVHMDSIHLSMKDFPEKQGLKLHFHIITSLNIIYCIFYYLSIRQFTKGDLSTYENYV